MKAEIEDYFQEELGIKLKVFDGGAQRTNLEFVVVQTSSEGKFTDIHQIIEADLPTDEAGRRHRLLRQRDGRPKRLRSPCRQKG